MPLKNLFRRKSVHQILKDVEQGFTDGEGGTGLSKVLQVRDLTFFGIAAIIGAGIFGTIGQAASSGGPAVSLLFIFIAVACGFSALCYAEFASLIPISGSAYTYSYVAFGELIAWIIGWDLLMEYSIGNITVALSWSSYFQTFIAGFGLHLPDYLTSDVVSAYNSFKAGDTTSRLYNAWVTAPRIGSLPFIVDIPAMFITVAITWLIYTGIKESRTATNIMVMLKLVVVTAVILIGAFYVVPANWTPFAPEGASGVLKGVAAVFFAYIGFDAISTTAEECQNPQRDLPRSMIYSLIICTVIYILMSFVLTGMENYKKLAVQDPLADVFKSIPSLNWLAGVIALSAIVATTSVFLVFQLGQPRIWMSMSRDGLLPKRFARIHPKYHTPGFSTVMTGFLVAVPLLFLNFTVVTNLTSIGTLFAFALVCAGVLVLHQKTDLPEPKFKVPHVNGKYIVPAIFIVGLIILIIADRQDLTDFILFRNSQDASQTFVKVAETNFPYWIFVIYAFLISWLAFRYSLSLIPILGLTMCVYLMSALTTVTWEGFLIWLVIGQVIYFLYGYKHSKLNVAKAA